MGSLLPAMFARNGAESALQIGTNGDDNPVEWTGLFGGRSLRVDVEVDFHGYTRAGMLSWLDANWARRSWNGLRRVRVIHGQGDVLPPALRNWSDAKGIPWAPESGNPGCTILHPGSRVESRRIHRTDRTNRTDRSDRTDFEREAKDVELFEKALEELPDPRKALRRKHGSA